MKRKVQRLKSNVQRLFLAFLLFLTLDIGHWALDAQSQHVEVSKNVGEPITIDFWGLPTDTTMFDGLTLEAAASINGPYVDVVTSIQKLDRSITFPTPVSPTFYRLYFFKIVNSVKQKSLPSNSIAVFVVNTGLKVL